MKIADKLLVIVVLTIIEISLTLWAVFEITKGATFHQLNSLHLKYSAVFNEQVFDIERGALISLNDLRDTILKIKQQPLDCLEQVNALNRFIMNQIGTIEAVYLCEKDIVDADYALKVLDRYEAKELDRDTLVSELTRLVLVFNENSALFEKPITKTVSFVFSSMIPMVVGISMFNVIFIFFMSRNIKESIQNVIHLLQKNNHSASSVEGDHTSIHAIIDNQVSGELKVLLNLAKERVEESIIAEQVNTQLEKEVEKRTQLLQKANTELSDFAYRASHDLSSPLTSSKSLVSFIKYDIEQGDLAEANNNLDKIYTLLAKQEKLIKNVLTLTKAESPEENRRKVDFTVIIADIKARLKSLIHQAKCDVDYVVDLKTSFIGNAERLEQVLENLISNSIKYSKPESTENYVKINIFENKTGLIIKVEDNGIGIPQGANDDVYKMFSRFHPQVSKGNGLGLSIVKKHIEAMDGSINYLSSSQGTCFTINLNKKAVT